MPYKELERKGKEPVIACFEVLSWHLLGQTEENHKNLSQNCQSSITYIIEIYFISLKYVYRIVLKNCMSHFDSLHSCFMPGRSWVQILVHRLDILINVFCGFPFRQIPGLCLKLGHNYFLLYPFHSTMYSLSY
jgi:hypothetical protein